MTESPLESRENMDNPTIEGPAQLLDFLFQVTHQAGVLRRRILISLVGLSWLLMALILHPLPFSDLINLIVNLFPGMATVGAHPFMDLAGRLWGTFMAGDVLAHLIALFFPFWLASEVAAYYLADIFELKNIETARHFAFQAAFAYPKYETLQIQNEASDQTQQSESNIIHIGGPGRVVVHLENLAIFERPNGAYNILGPTFREPGGAAILQGFERLRTVVDLRDVIYPLVCVEGRTRDGIRINLRNLRVLFSVNRGSQPASLSQPYPFLTSSVYGLVYHQSSGSWTDTVLHMIENELKAFINTRYLSELLASIGAPEFEHPFLNNSERIQFVPRSDLSRRFYQEFSQRFESRGIRLEWVDVGVWETPAQVIPKQYIEAWKLSRENMMQSGESVLAKLQKRAQLNQLADLIRVVVASFHNMQDQCFSPNDVIYNIIENYRKIIFTTISAAEDAKEDLPDELAQAHKFIHDYQNSVEIRQMGHKLDG